MCFGALLRVWTISWPILAYKGSLEVCPLRPQKRRFCKLGKRALVTFYLLQFQGQGQRTSRSNWFSKNRQKWKYPMVQVVFLCDVYSHRVTGPNFSVPVLSQWASGAKTTFCNLLTVWGLISRKDYLRMRFSYQATQVCSKDLPLPSPAVHSFTLVLQYRYPDLTKSVNGPFSDSWYRNVDKDCNEKYWL